MQKGEIRASLSSCYVRLRYSGDMVYTMPQCLNSLGASVGLLGLQNLGSIVLDDNAKEHAENFGM